jgi:hypothetical protein
MIHDVVRVFTVPLEFALKNWDVLVAFFLGAGGIKGTEAVITKVQAWLAARAAAAEAAVETETKTLEAVVDARIKAALASLTSKV